MKNTFSKLFGLPTDIQKNPVPVLHPGVAQKVDGTSASAKTTAAYSATENAIVRIAALSGTADYIWIKIGANPTAVADTSMALQIGTSEYFNVLAGEQVAVLGGIANVTLMS